TVSTSNPNIDISQPSGSPKGLTVQFGATLPVAGDTITVNFTLPDGTADSITMTAVAEPGSPGSFLIGTDATATAESFETALRAQVKTLAEGRMVTASAYAAAENFFYAQGGQPLRVEGAPEASTGLK